MWNQPGVTVKRYIPDQTQTITNWSTSTQNIPFQYLRTVGYLSALYLSMPSTNFAIIGGINGAAPGGFFPQLNMVSRFQLTLQAIATIYDVRGYSLGFLDYVGNGNAQAKGPYYGATGYWARQDNAAAPNPFITLFPFQYPALTYGDVASGETISNYLSAASAPSLFINNSNTVVGVLEPIISMAYHMRIPISETIRFPNTIISTDAQNNHMVTDAPLEVGFIFMQNNQQNVVPSVTLSKLFSISTTATPSVSDDSVLGYSNGITSLGGIQNIQWLLEDEFYDVPPNPADRPFPFQLSFVVTRQEVDWFPSGGSVTVKYRSAGLLCRVLYVGYTSAIAPNVFYPADLGRPTTSAAGGFNGSQSTYPNIVFKSGSTIVTIQETSATNIARSQIRYGGPMPGILVHDFIGDTAGAGASIVQAVDLGSLIDVRTEFTNLVSSITRLSSVEQRLIPVEVSQ